MIPSDNLTIQGMWKGPRLSPMELLTIRSFQAHGHRFVLWLYDELETPLPPDTVTRDASEIIARDQVFGGREGVHWLTNPRYAVDDQAHAIHWCQEWTRGHAFDKARPIPGTFYDRCLRHYGLT